MVIFVLSMLLVLLLMIAIFFMRIKIDVTIITSISENSATLKVSSLYGLFRLKKKFTLHDLPLEPMQNEWIDKSLSGTKWWEPITTNYQSYKQVLITFIKKITIQMFSWSTHIGMGDAASTAVTSGVLWSLKSMLATYIKCKMTCRKGPIIQVFPNYQHFAFQSTIKCMLVIKAGNAIVTGIKLYRIWKKNLTNVDEDSKNMRENMNRRTING